MVFLLYSVKCRHKGFPDRANYIHSAHRPAKNILLVDRDFHALLRTHENMILALNRITTTAGMVWVRGTD
ncbi:hypothetical protein ACN4EK_15820 [Pantanalinema rosaneae CENA516]|uniref:hypothetical protein n=1 Tax=Pantanalinema rosaneae TaxID=1620701 RepID=UPI003D6ED970